MTVTGDLTVALSASLDAVTSALGCIGWAEDEISRAMKRHPEADDELWHSFSLVRPTSDRMYRVEFLFRGHARELLERVAAGEDTRPGTAAEACLVCCAASQVTPMNTPGAGLYFRMWRQAFPGIGPLSDEDMGGHYEAICASEIDDYESEVRRRLADPRRTLSGETCTGWHHGEPAPGCRFAAARTPRAEGASHG